MTRLAHFAAAQASIEETERTSRQVIGLYTDAATARRLRRPNPGHTTLRAVLAGL